MEYFILFHVFFSRLSFWLACIEHNDYVDRACYSFNYPVHCENSLVNPELAYPLDRTVYIYLSVMRTFQIDLNFM